MKRAAPLKQAIDKIIAKMTAIMSRKETVAAVLKHYASKAKDPASSIMNDLGWRKEIVALGEGATRGPIMYWMAASGGRLHGRDGIGPALP